MSNSRPPPLPDLKSAVKTYGRALLYLVTALVFIFFAHTFLMPKIEAYWVKVGQRSAPLAAMFSAVDFLKSNAVLIYIGIIVLVAVLEACTFWWRRFRGVFVEVIVYVIIVTTLSMYAAIAVAAVILAPLMYRPE